MALFYTTFLRLLDDLGHEVDMTDSRLQQTLQKIEKVLRLSDGKRGAFVSIPGLGPCLEGAVVYGTEVMLP